MTSPVSGPLALAGPAGRLEAMLDLPASAASPSAVMLVCHPHPLHGGTMNNKVVTTLARCATALGAASLRFNYRGVGASEGSYDEGRGETEDAVAAVAWLRQQWPAASLWIGGFSFGGRVALRAANHADVGAIAKLVTVAPAITRDYGAPEEIIAPSCPWLVVQGDADEVIDAAAVIGWCKRISPQPALAVMPGAGHFFHGQLGTLQGVVTPFLTTVP